MPKRKRKEGDIYINIMYIYKRGAGKEQMVTARTVARRSSNSKWDVTLTLGWREYKKDQVSLNTIK